MTSLSPRPAEPLPTSLAGLLRRPVLWPVALRAVAELAVARVKLGRRHVRDLLHEATPGADRPPTLPEPRHDAVACRISWAVTRMAARVPWRSDCLVQALAARRWLDARGVPNDLHIGVRNSRPTGFEAHAWLTHGDRIVTGGDISGFVPLISPVQRPASQVS